jgi:hypothetical protein
MHSTVDIVTPKNKNKNGRMGDGHTAHENYSLPLDLFRGMATCITCMNLGEAGEKIRSEFYLGYAKVFIPKLR